MLKIKSITWNTNENIAELDAYKLFAKNPSLQFDVEAPIYWWLCLSNFNIHHFLKDEQKLDEICTDKWENCAVLDKLKIVLEQLSVECVINPKKELDRQLMQILPCGAVLRGCVCMYYEDIYYLVNDTEPELMDNGAQREWDDFIETLMDIKGIRTLCEDGDF